VAYANLSAVTARAGALARAWTAESAPSFSDIEGFLDDVAAEIDALVAARGLTPPLAGSAAANALRGVNADGALVLALEATYPETSGPSSAAKTLDDARRRYEQAVEALTTGTHPAVAVLEASADAPSATSFWQQEPGYGQQTPTTDDLNPYTAPAFARGQPL